MDLHFPAGHYCTITHNKTMQLKEVAWKIPQGFDKSIP